jgi:hypothetical protein
LQMKLAAYLQQPAEEPKVTLAIKI